MKEFYSKHKHFFIVSFTLICFAYFFIWSALKQFNYGPDEDMRFPVINYIFKYGSLPSGWDESTKSESWGFSYAFFFTFLPSLFSAAFMKVTSLFTLSSQALLIASRLPNVIVQAGTVYLVFRIVDKLSKNELIKWFITVMFAFIPQLAFLSSYCNNDCFSLFGSALICFAWVCAYEKGWNVKNCILLSVGIIVNVLSYYNSYTWILLSIFLFYISFAFDKNKDKRKKILSYTILIIAIVLSVTGFFLIRNLYLYHGDLFGISSLNESRSLYAIDKLKPEYHETIRSMGYPFRSIVLNQYWIESSFNSFIGVFGYTMFECPQWFYSFYTILLSIGGLFFVVDSILVIVNKTAPNRGLNITYRIFITAAFFMPILLSMYYSWNYDYQAQGRYTYPMFPAFAIIQLLGWSCLFRLLGKRSAKVRIVLNVIQIIIMVAVTASSLYMFKTVYLPSEFGDNSVLQEVYGFQ